MLTAEQWQAKVGAPFTPSKYQCEIFEWIVNGKGNAVVEAVAGSGKSTTIQLSARLVLVSAVYVAFNNPVVKEMKPKLQGTKMEVRTTYSLGFGAIRFANRNLKKITVEDPDKGIFKYKPLIQKLENDLNISGTILGYRPNPDELQEMKNSKGAYSLPMGVIMKLFDLARLDLVDFHGPNYPMVLWDIANHHNIDIPPYLDKIVADVIKYLAEVGRQTVSIIDYTDMVWLPHVNNYRPKGYMFVAVDECQDVNKAQLEIVRRCVKRGGRFLAIGDRKQAIYAWCGADAQAFENIISTMKAKVLPLSVCYRCPKSGIRLAQQWVPQIEAAPNAPEGTVEHLKYDEMLEKVQWGDMVLCRKNAPLVGAAFSIITKGIPATVKGRAIGNGLIKTIKNISKHCTFERFGNVLQEWSEKEKGIIMSRGGDDAAIESRCSAVDDTTECMRIFYQREDVNSFADMLKAIDDLFSDDVASVTLSSIHRAKGLENDRIFLLGPTEICFRGQKPWMREQEANLSYVAHTRHKEALFYVEEKGK